MTCCREKSSLGRLLDCTVVDSQRRKEWKVWVQKRVETIGIFQKSSFLSTFLNLENISTIECSVGKLKNCSFWWHIFPSWAGKRCGYHKYLLPKKKGDLEEKETERLVLTS